jgi:hypothetical protein
MYAFSAIHSCLKGNSIFSKIPVRFKAIKSFSAKTTERKKLDEIALKRNIEFKAFNT